MIWCNSANLPIRNKPKPTMRYYLEHLKSEVDDAFA